MPLEKIRIGTRGSDLALWQARWVQKALAGRFPGLPVELVIIKTTGDKILDAPLSRIGDKGLFTREIEHSLLEGAIDLAVHSLKDLPTQLPEGLTIGAVTEREDVRDVFLPHPSNPRLTLEDQLQDASVATGSLRRRCQLAAIRPDISIVEIRGNLNTRMKKLEESDWAGMILARAGVVRLGWEGRIGELISTEVMLPAVGQGALGIEIREGDPALLPVVASLTHHPTERGTTAERALMRRLEGGCQIPVGAYGRISGWAAGNERLTLEAMVGSLDGSTLIRGRLEGSAREAEQIGTRLAEELLSRGGRSILEQIRSAGEDNL
jgi:hydroxymethylbilane synthase